MGAGIHGTLFNGPVARSSAIGRPPMLPPPTNRATARFGAFPAHPRPTPTQRPTDRPPVPVVPAPQRPTETYLHTTPRPNRGFTPIPTPGNMPAEKPTRRCIPTGLPLWHGSCRARFYHHHHHHHRSSKQPQNYQTVFKLNRLTRGGGPPPPPPPPLLLHPPSTPPQILGSVYYGIQCTLYLLRVYIYGS